MVLSILISFANNFNYLSPDELHIWILNFNEIQKNENLEEL